jgi:hypothetical protein
VPAKVPSLAEGDVMPVDGHGAGLRPPFPTSVEPSGTVGIPSVVLVAGDVLAEAVVLVVKVWLQALLDPEPRPAGPICVASVPTPPALKRAPEFPAVPKPLVPSPLPVPTPEPGTPDTKPVHVVVGAVPRLLVGPIGPGAMPGVASSVAPSGMPVGPTVDPVDGVPSGEVIPTPGLVPITCA